MNMPHPAKINQELSSNENDIKSLNIELKESQNPPVWISLRWALHVCDSLSLGISARLSSILFCIGSHYRRIPKRCLHSIVAPSRSSKQSLIQFLIIHSLCEDIKVLLINPNQYLKATFRPFFSIGTLVSIHGSMMYVIRGDK